MEVIPLRMEMVMVVTDVGSPHRPVVVDLLVCLGVVGMETTETMETVGVVETGMAEDLGEEAVEVVRPPDGGDGGGDPDDFFDDDDDDDERFIRRMRRLFGGMSAPEPTSEQGKVKEADTIKLPAFPAAETYRNWRIKTREAVMSASTKPDKAFDWISETWKEDQTVEALREVAPFATLDAKLLSSLTNILTGDFARTIDTFKETEAAKGRYVRGRQVLLKMHQHFSTNIKHGATYALQDLFNVKLKGENLKVFLSNWDQVLAGIQKIPDDSVLETLFLNQVKNSKNISHDLQEYYRAEDGSTATKSYDYLITAVRRFLERERLEVNRERIARNLGASKTCKACDCYGWLGWKRRVGPEWLQGTGFTKPLSTKLKPTGRSQASGVIVSVPKLTTVSNGWAISRRQTRELLMLSCSRTPMPKITTFHQRTTLPCKNSLTFTFCGKATRSSQLTLPQ